MKEDRSQKVLDLLWAKKADKNGSPMWLPLTVHLEDVMIVSGLLWNHWLTSGQRLLLLQSVVMEDQSPADEDTVLKLIRFISYIHDIGKATPVFQIQKGFSNSPDLDRNLLERLEQTGLTGITALTLANPKVSHHTVTGEYLLTKMGVREDIASIVGAHHGKSVDSEELIKKQSSYPANLWQKENDNDPVAKLWKKVQKNILNLALAKSGFDSVNDLPEINETGQVLISGLLIMADWIASNEYYFPLISFETLHIDNPEKRWYVGWHQWYKGEPLEILSDHSSESEFENRFGFRPRAFQQEFYETVQTIKKPGIVILEAPMGSGKTEAALAAAEVMMRKSRMGGIYFGLPTQATSNGIFPRIENWLEEISYEYGQKTTLKLMHGKAALNQLQEELAAGIHIDEDGDSGVYTAAWFAGRKTSILSDDAVGTVDQVLLMALKQKHLALRHLGFSRKVVIIDEVHAYDAYMNVYLSEALEWLGAYKIPVILLSATLPYERRRDLLVSYLRGTGMKKKELRQYENIFNTSAYPVMTYSDGKALYQKLLPIESDKTSVSVHRINEDRFISKIRDLLHDGGVAGIIVNTVSKAQEVYNKCLQIYTEDEVLLLHSHFIATDRTILENHLIHMIGKGGRRPNRLIVVGTQVLEQSLDIDFDVLFTELCPMDLLLQRIGRMHRHKIERPVKMRNPEVYVMGISDSIEFDGGSSAVYDSDCLARTQAVLPEKICMPDDISPLVQKVYENTDFKWSEDVQRKYDQAVLDAEDKKAEKEHKAETFRIDHPHLKVNPEKYNLIGWLKTDFDTQSDETAYAQVRDSSETVEVIAVIRCGSGYGFFEKKEDITDLTDQFETARTISMHTLRLSTGMLCAASGSVNGAIQWLEEYNKSNLYSWQRSTWLKGSLGIIFEPDGTFIFDHVLLQYNTLTGLSYKKIRTGNHNGKI